MPKRQMITIIYQYMLINIHHILYIYLQEWAYTDPDKDISNKKKDELSYTN